MRMLNRIQRRDWQHALRLFGQRFRMLRRVVINALRKRLHARIETPASGRPATSANAAAPN